MLSSCGSRSLWVTGPILARFLEWPNENSVFDALEVVSLDVEMNTTVSKFKITCGVAGPMNLKLSWEFLLTDFELVVCRPCSFP